MRLLRGEEVDLLSRELGMTAAMLSAGREEFLAARQSCLQTRSKSEPDDETRDLEALIGVLAIDSECLEPRLRNHEERAPVAFRGSKP